MATRYPTKQTQSRRPRRAAPGGRGSGGADHTPGDFRRGNARRRGTALVLATAVVASVFAARLVDLQAVALVLVVLQAEAHVLVVLQVVVRVLVVHVVVVHLPCQQHQQP